MDPEFTQAEAPLIRQLEGMGWTHLAGSAGAPAPKDPGSSGRSSFNEVILLDALRRAVRTLNLDPSGVPWPDDRRVAEAVGAITRIPAPSLLEANKHATDLLINGITVEGRDDWDGGRGRRVHFIDWERPRRNEFTVVSQFRLDIPGTLGKKHITPDLVLFVNGIPLVVIECKKPGTQATLQAVTQLQRYAETDGKPGESRTRSGRAELFHTVQLMVAASGEDARLGTFTAGPEHYVPWRDPYPLTREDLGEHARPQELLAGVVLEPERLLDIVHNYVTFMEIEGRTVKIAPRYQQYRAVEKSIAKLLNGKTKAQDGVNDQRGGIIWHTQGSGKSLTMTFLVRKLRSTPTLAETKVVVVTDRTQLQKQLKDTMALTGEKSDTARNVKRAKVLLSRKGPGLVFVMIQKQHDIEARKAFRTEDVLTERKTPSLGVLNTDESIVVLIDEAHRSHGSALHTNLTAALPNCARIGFTGTPILKNTKVRDSTVNTFGTFIDKYRLKEAEEDGVIVPIFYEGHTVKGAVRDGRDLDDVFEDLFDLTDDEREELQRRYATKSDVMEAEKLVAAKARSMLRHYVGTVLPGGFKAQVVAGSREATVRYREAFLAARAELVAQIETLPPHLLAADPEEIRDRRKAFLVRAHAHVDAIKAMDFVPVISPGAAKDEQRYEEWTDPDKQEDRIKAFKRPGPITFLIVKSMLLTGFDAAIEQVLYIDRSLKEAELLQAVARVNRTAKGKSCGYVVDYFGVANHLQEALKAYARDDIEGALKDLTDEIAKLDPLARRLRLLFTDRGVRPGPAETVIEECVRLLGDGMLRERFEVELKRFLTVVNAVMPNAGAKPYLADARLFAEIKMRAQRRYRLDDGEFDPSLYGAKVRELIDEHLEALGVERVLPPVSLTAPDFREKVAALGSARAKASEMEHAVRHHITGRFGEDPVRYKRLSERLEEILTEHRENWEQQILLLGELMEELEKDSSAGPPGLGPVESALYGLLLEETAVDGMPDPEAGERVVALSRALHRLAVTETTRRDFWRKQVDQINLTKRIAVLLLDSCAADQAAELADKVFQVVRANRNRIVTS